MASFYVLIKTLSPMKVHISHSQYEVPILHIDKEYDLIVVIFKLMPI